MALSPTDFYAYSRATGIPFPEDPEERVQMAPEVLEFRRNQLKTPEQNPDYGNIAGVVATGLGLAAGGLGLSRLFRKSAPRATAQSNIDLATRASQPVTTISKIDLSVVQPSKVVVEPKTFTKNYLDEVLEGADAEIGALTESERTIEPKPFNLTYIETTGAKAPDLTSIQQSQLPMISAQQQAAVESGEDQITGRIKHRLQQDEDLDTSQIEVMEGMAEEQYRIGMEQEDPALRRGVSSQEFVDLAKQEMINRRQAVQASGLRPGTERFERALAQSFVTKSIPGAEPGTVNFRNLQDLNKTDISLPSTIRRAVDIVEETGPEEALEPKRLRSVLNVGPSAEITATAMGGAIRGASPLYNEALPKQNLRQTFGTPDVLVQGAPDELTADIPGRQRLSNALSSDVPIEELSKQEIQYAFLNETPIAIPKGGSAGIGLYGIEPRYVPGAMSKATGEYSEKASQKPSYVPNWLLKREQTPFSDVSNEGLQRALERSSLSGSRSVTKEIDRREKANKSVIASEALRRAKIEGRDPQMILKQLGIGI